MIQNATWNSITYSRASQKGVPGLPFEIRRLISEKRKSQAKWQGSRYPSDKTKCNKLTRQYTTAIFDYKTKQYNDYTESLTTTDKSLWTVTQKYCSKKPHHASTIPKNNREWVKSDEEKAEEFATHLTQIFTLHPEILDPSHAAHVDSNLSTPLQMSLPPKAFCLSDINHTIKTLKKKRNPLDIT